MTGASQYTHECRGPCQLSTGLPECTLWVMLDVRSALLFPAVPNPRLCLTAEVSVLVLLTT